MSTINIDIIDKVISRLEKEPEHFDMDSYATRTHCGTVCCIAGWAAVEKEGANPSQLRRMDDEDFEDFLLPPGAGKRHDDWYGLGRDALGIDNAAADVLFFDGCWTDPFATDYEAAKSRKARAAVAIRLLREVRERGVWWAS